MSSLPVGNGHWSLPTLPCPAYRQPQRSSSTTRWGAWKTKARSPSGRGHSTVAARHPTSTSVDGDAPRRGATRSCRSTTRDGTAPITRRTRQCRDAAAKSLERAGAGAGLPCGLGGGSRPQGRTCSPRAGAGEGSPPAFSLTRTMGAMVDEGQSGELDALLVVAEDIRDGRRTEPFTHDELSRLCGEIRRAIALLSEDTES